MTDFYEDKEVIPLLKLERLLSACDSVDFAILSHLKDGESYEEIAEALFMSVNGIKYRLKRLCDISSVGGKREMVELLRSC